MRHKLKDAVQPAAPGVTRRSRRRLFVAVILIATPALGALLWLFGGVPEPRHGGKRLSEWIDEYGAIAQWRRNDPDCAERKAIRSIGTNAIPWLLNELQTEGSAAHFRINQWLDKQSLIQFRFPDINERLRRASLGFEALGALAAPAIPEVAAAVDDAIGYAPEIFVSIGAPATEEIHLCLTNLTSVEAAGKTWVAIPGNTIGAIQNALNFGGLSREEVEVFVPKIRDWSAQTTNSHAATYAAAFLTGYDNPPRTSFRMDKQ